MYKEYTISSIRLLNEDSGSAILIDENEKQISVELMRTTKGTWLAHPGNNLVLSLLSSSGDELSSIEDYDSVFVNEAIHPDSQAIICD